MSSPLFERHRALGARFADEGTAAPLQYGNLQAELSAAREAVVLLDLSHVSVFELNCREARRWGNGMFTNNIKRLREGLGNRNAMCDDRGRVLGLLDLYFNSPTQFTIVLDGVDRDWFEAHYRMYLVLDDVELEPDAEDAQRVLSLQGPGAEALLAGLGWELPDGERAHLLREDGIRVCRRGRSGLPGFDLLMPMDALAGAWDQLLDAGATPVGSEAMEVLRVLRGEARWPVDGEDKTLIHQLGLESELCAFDKGCYLGQEVINRVDVKGAVNKKITGMRLMGEGLPPVSSEVQQDGKTIGRLTSVVRQEGHFIGIGILRKTAWEPGSVILIEADGERWTGETVELPLS
jgi:folate-binding protein YgfZ